MQWFESINLKDIILLALGALAGYVCSMLVAKQTEKKKNLSLKTTGRRIIIEAADACPFRVIDANGNSLSNVYLINVRIWNRGNEHILGTDISSENALRISLLDNAEVVGDPIIFRGGHDIGLKVTGESHNEYRIDFECLNADEWGELGFFVKDNPRIRLEARGRIFGQNKDFRFELDDGRETFGARMLNFAIIALVAASPISIAIALYQLYHGHYFVALLLDPGSVPDHVKQWLGFGLVIPSFAVTYHIDKLVKRKRNPKTYPLDEDYEPSQAQNIGAMWGTALSGKRYQVSSSAHSPGQIIVPNVPLKSDLPGSGDKEIPPQG